MKNNSIKGLKDFILTLKKEHTAGTLGTWWNEHTNKTYDSIKDFYVLNGKEHTFNTVRNLVDYVITNLDTISEDELVAAANRAQAKSLLLESRRFYMYEQLEAKKTTSEAELAIELPVDTLEKVEQEVTIELQDNQDNITEVVIIPSVADYESMSDEQLRKLAKDAKIKGYHNAKRETLIEKLKG
jgi:hypothetical protein